MSEREKWNASINDLFDSGMMREIYYNEDFSICNLADTCYVIFDYMASNGVDIPTGFAVVATKLEMYINNPDLFNRWVCSIPESELGQNLICFDDRVKEILKLKKQKAELEGPKISLEYEQYLIDTYSQQKDK